MAFGISPSPRVRRSPFFDSTVADGVVSFTPYNRMLMPTGYGDPEAEYDRLLNGVAMWDVSVERQVELRGPDAARLAQILTPRKLDKLRPGVGWYVAICNYRGTLINDPILLKLDEDRFWFSIADGDLVLFARTIAAERGLDVDIFEPDVSPLAVQGPKAENVVASLLGESVRDIGFFRFRPYELDDIPLMVARSGWSKQGGFELYLLDGTRGDDLWGKVKQAGKPFDIGPGTPNPSERVESGLLSYGVDTDDDTNPFEVRLDRFVDLDAPDDVVGIAALRSIHAEGPRRHQLGIKLELDGCHDQTDRWSTVHRSSALFGHVTAHAWSPRLQQNIGLALVSRDLETGDAVDVTLANGQATRGTLCELPFM